MKTITKSISDLLNGPAAIAEMCKGNQVVVLMKDDEAKLVIASPDFFNELIEKANKTETYRELWQAEVDARQGKMISAKQALEEIERVK